MYVAVTEVKSYMCGIYACHRPSPTIVTGRKGRLLEEWEHTMREMARYYLLSNHGHGRTLVQQTQLARGVLCVSRVPVPRQPNGHSRHATST